MLASNESTFILPTRDALYGTDNNSSSANFARPTTAAVMLGVLHTANGTANRCAYSSAGVDVTESSPSLGALNKQTSWLSHRQLAGSAARYFGDGDGDAGDDDGAAAVLAGSLFAVDYLPAGYCADPAWASPWYASSPKRTKDRTFNRIPTAIPPPNRI